MPLQKLDSLHLTKHIPYYHLRGTLPTGFRILNKKQIKQFNLAKDKLNKRKTVRVGVQLHHNERVLDKAQNTAYKAIMKAAHMHYKR